MFGKSAYSSELERYTLFFLALDSFILIMRGSSKIAFPDKLAAAKHCLLSYLQAFVREIKAPSSVWLDRDRELATNLAKANNLFEVFELASSYLASIEPNLDSGYKDFWSLSIGKSWNDLS